MTNSAACFNFIENMIYILLASHLVQIVHKGQIMIWLKSIELIFQAISVQIYIHCIKCGILCFDQCRIEYQYILLHLPLIWIFLFNYVPQATAFVPKIFVAYPGYFYIGRAVFK